MSRVEASTRFPTAVTTIDRAAQRLLAEALQCSEDASSTSCGCAMRTRQPWRAVRGDGHEEARASKAALYQLAWFWVADGHDVDIWREKDDRWVLHEHMAGVE